MTVERCDLLSAYSYDRVRRLERVHGENAKVDSTKLLCVVDVAARLNLSTSTVYQLVAGKKISHRRIGGAIRFHESDIGEYVESTKRGRKSADSWPTKTNPSQRATPVRRKDWF